MGKHACLQLPKTPDFRLVADWNMQLWQNSVFKVRHPSFQLKNRLSADLGQNQNIGFIFAACVLVF